MTLIYTFLAALLLTIGLIGHKMHEIRKDRNTIFSSIFRRLDIPTTRAFGYIRGVVIRKKEQIHHFVRVDAPHMAAEFAEEAGEVLAEKYRKVLRRIRGEKLIERKEDRGSMFMRTMVDHRKRNGNGGHGIE